MTVEKEVTTQNETAQPDPQPPAWAERSALEQKIRIELRKEYEVLHQMWKDNDLAEVAKENEKIIQQGLQKMFDKWVEEQKPPSDEDIQKLLSQEYQTFNVQVTWMDDEQKDHNEVFVIRELPQSLEIKFFQTFKTRILDKSQELAALAQEQIDQPFEVKVKAMLNLVDEGFGVLAETCAIILNPYGKKSYIDTKWVQNNISSDRQWNIVDAQIKVNRIKDFFSKVSLSGQQSQTMMASVPRFQQLQQLVR